MIFSKVKLAIAVIFSLLLFNNVRLTKKVNDLDKQVGIAMNNAQVWEDIANQNKNEARLLELTVNDFRYHSKNNPFERKGFLCRAKTKSIDNHHGG